MKQWWKQYAARFEARSVRERLLIALTMLAVIVVLGYAAVIQPPLSRVRVLERQLMQQKAELLDIQQRIAVAKTSVTDQDAAARANLERTQRQTAEINTRLKTVSQALVPPDKVGQLL